MTDSALIYLFLAYGVFLIVPLALLVIILVRLNHVSCEVAALRRRLDGVPDARQASPHADREGA